MQVPDLLRNPAKRFPDRVAVIEGSRRLTFAEVDRRADQLAAAMQARGIEHGDRVALLAMNELEYLEIQVAAQRLGAILVPLNYRLAVPELDYIVRSSGCRLLIHGPGYEVTAKQLGVGDNLHLGPTGHGDSYDDALASQTDPAAFGPLLADTPCTILYTSGTTGRPKGAVLSNLSVYARCACQRAGAAREARRRLRPDPADVPHRRQPRVQLHLRRRHPRPGPGVLAPDRAGGAAGHARHPRAARAHHHQHAEQPPWHRRGALRRPADGALRRVGHRPRRAPPRHRGVRLRLPAVLRHDGDVGLLAPAGAGPRSGRPARPAGVGRDRRRLVRDPGGRPGRPRVPTGRRGRDRDPRSGADGRLLGRPRRDRRGPPRRMDAHGRPRLPLARRATSS